MYLRWYVFAQTGGGGSFLILCPFYKQRNMESNAKQSMQSKRGVFSFFLKRGGSSPNHFPDKMRKKKQQKGKHSTQTSRYTSNVHPPLCIIPSTSAALMYKKVQTLPKYQCKGSAPLYKCQADVQKGAEPSTYQRRGLHPYTGGLHPYTSAALTCGRVHTLLPISAAGVLPYKSCALMYSRVQTL